jgi:hypothetical protein
MWVMAASPLLTCTDVRKMSPFLKEILMNEDVLAVHKDPLARMATRIDVGGGLHELTSSGLCRNDFPVCQEYDSCTHCTNNVSVWAKPLASGETAVMIMNRDNHSIASAAVLLPDIGDGMLATFSARDLWAQQDLGVHSNAISLAVPAHGIRLLKLTPPRPPAPTPPRVCPPGFTNHAAGYWANLEPCNACPHDGQNATGSLCGAKCEKTMGCKGFEVYAGPGGSPACFIFVGELAPPFTANAGCLTCVSLIHATAEEAAAEVGDTDSRGAELDILVENFGRVTGNPVGMDRTFRGISRWVNAGSQQLADWTIAPLPLTNVSVLAQSTKWSKSKAGGSGALPPVVAFYRGSFTIAEGNLGDTFVTLHGWGKGIAFANGHALQRYWSSVGPQVSFYCPAEWLLEGANTLVLFETGRGPAADLTVTLRANHTIVG